MRRVANFKLNDKALDSNNVVPEKLTPRKQYKQPTDAIFPQWHQPESPDAPKREKPTPKFAFG